MSMTGPQHVVEIALNEAEDANGGDYVLLSKMAKVACNAVPNGWAKVEGEWVRLVSIDVVADDGETLTCWAKGPRRAKWRLT